MLSISESRESRESWESRSLGSLGVLGVSGVSESQTVNCTKAGFHLCEMNSICLRAKTHKEGCGHIGVLQIYQPLTSFNVHWYTTCEPSEICDFSHYRLVTVVKTQRAYRKLRYTKSKGWEFCLCFLQCILLPRHAPGQPAHICKKLSRPLCERLDFGGLLSRA